MMTGEHEVYLSRLLLNHRSRDVRRDLGNCHELGSSAGNRGEVHL